MKYILKSIYKQRFYIIASSLFCLDCVFISNIKLIKAPKLISYLIIISIPIISIILRLIDDSIKCKEANNSRKKINYGMSLY